MSTEWIVYIIASPIAFGMVYYLTWLVTGIFDSLLEDSRKKKGKPQYDGFCASSYAPYFIIFFTNLYSVEAMRSHSYAGTFPTTSFGWVMFAAICFIDAWIIRLTSYAFTRKNIGEMLALLNVSRYTAFTLCMVIIDFIYSYCRYGNTDEFPDIESVCCVWIGLLIITFVTGVVMNKDSN